MSIESQTERGPAPWDEKPLRVLVAPKEVAGQMQIIAEGLRQRGYGATALSYEALSNSGRVIDRSFGFNHRQPRIWKLYRMSTFFLQALRSYDVFHFFYGRSLLPGYLDLPILKRSGKKIFVHFRGSDIRQRRYLYRVVQPQLMGQASETGTSPSSAAQLRMLQTWRKYANAILLANPDMLRIVPEGILVQQGIDLKRWEFSPEVAGSRPEEIVIAHAPTDRAYKGTEFVIEAVERLKADGCAVKLLLIENTPHDRVKGLFKSCHIGVDELLQGIPANVSIELMSIGRPVVANVDPWYAQHRPDLPVVSAGPLDLAEKLRPLVEDQQLRIKLGMQGRRYVERWHDVDRLIDQLIEIYQS